MSLRTPHLANSYLENIYLLGTNAFKSAAEWASLFQRLNLQGLDVLSVPLIYPLVEEFAPSPQHVGLMTWFRVRLDNDAATQYLLNQIAMDLSTDCLLYDYGSKTTITNQQSTLSSANQSALEAADWPALLSELPGGIAWMGILNITPDSFSDGGVNNSLENLQSTVDQQLNAGVAIVDLGGQSTRPGATKLTVEEEWQRLAPALDQTVRQLSDWAFPVDISVDTYHPEIAQRAIDHGATIINDVSGLEHPDMIEVFCRNERMKWIVMHQLSIPADKSITFAAEDDVMFELNTWAEKTWQRLSNLNPTLSTDQVWLDPGLGFGKNPAQNQFIIRSFKTLHTKYHWLMAHSRKSFLNHLLLSSNSQNGGVPTNQRDAGSIGAAIMMMQQGCKAMRVHNVPDCVTATNAALASTSVSL